MLLEQRPPLPRQIWKHSYRRAVFLCGADAAIKNPLHVGGGFGRGAGKIFRLAREAFA